ncbi:MAG TPA: ABC transporter substrate-binding protein, partial [Methanospirillum sp.]|uniref:ABC transporter substrate-binding protein n=1 Tax=Methanospirillum sp. TaxID=45200 RepID=UPI002CA03774
QFCVMVCVLFLIGMIPCVMAEGGSVLKIAGPWDGQTDPHVSGTSLQRLGVTETLTDVDQSAALIPGLATSWDVSGDQLVWTFHLRDGVKFHDGTAFTAKTMKKSLDDSLKKSKTFAKVPIKDITAVDDKTLQISLTKPFPALPAYMAKGESAALADASLDQGNVTKPIGTGPFKFESFNPKEEMITVKNPDYWGKKASVDEVDYKVVPEAATRSLQLQGGDIDIAQIMPPEISSTFASKSDFKVNDQPIARVRMIDYNCESGPFSDEKVRQAMNYAFDRQAIVDYVLDGVGSSASGLFPPQFYWANKDIQPFTYDPDKAKSMLAEAGWKDTNNDGILDKDGKKFSIKLVTYPERAELPSIAEVMQDQLKKIGIDVELKVIDTDSANAMRNKGDFDIALVGRGLLFTPDPDEIMMTDYDSAGTSGDGWGAYRWSNSRVDELIEKARATTDAAERKKYYDEVQKIVIDESPVAYLNYYVNQDITSNKVKGYRMHPTELSYHLEDVTLG